MIETQNLIRQRTNHVCRLCCSRAPQAVLQGAPLDCSNETHCSAAWSMAPAGYPTCILGATAEAPRQGHGSATQPNKPKKNPETRHKRIRRHPPPDRGRRYQERIQETLEAPYPQASVTKIVKLLTLAWVSIANALVTPNFHKSATHARPKVWQPGRCRYNQIPGRRDQQSTVWTRRHQRTNQGGGAGGGRRRERAKPQQHQNQEQKRANSRARNTEQRQKETRNPQPRQKEKTKGSAEASEHQTQTAQPKQDRETQPQTQHPKRRKKGSNEPQKEEEAHQQMKDPKKGMN